MNKNIVLEANNVFKEYTQENNKYEILKNINFSLAKKEIVGLIGPSGSGKTTLLNLLGMLDTPSSGEIFVNGVATSGLADKEKTNLRGSNIGFVFQFHHLFPDFTCLENVMFPLRIQGVQKNIALSRAEEILEKMGLSERRNNYPTQISGGEQQRTAIARAIVFNPKIIIADEPTGNLDTENAQMVFNLLLGLVETLDTAIIVATHDTNIANQIPKKIKIENKTLINI
ncbi:MAG: ABC transporter ATP-binding protein [Alphaproteobacteria bacterium]|jgi:lipoprotein-releasing system ATP-binding protein|nr:ABC transporter ATP-binding protein [Alphaproteobacteria bacterium]